MTHKITGTVSNHGGVSYRIRAFRADTGAFLAGANSSAVDGTYTVNLTYTGLVIAVMDRYYATKGWSADTILGGDIRTIPTTPNGHYYRDAGLTDDPNYSNVSLLLPMRGANASTVFTDFSPTQKTITPSGNVQISTAQSKYYGSSGLFDGSSDYLNAGNVVAPTADFTMEVWVRFLSGSRDSVSQTIVSKWIGTAASTSQSFFWDFKAPSTSTVPDRFTFDWRAGSTTYRSFEYLYAFSFDVWYHVAVSRAGNDLRGFVDGTLISTLTPTDAPNSNNTDLWIGAINRSTTDFDTRAHINDFRYSSGVARYTANFTPPSQLTYKTGATEPVWPTTGGSVVDNEITWTDQGDMSIPRVEGPIIPVPV